MAKRQIHFPQIALILAFSVVGGLNSIAVLAGAAFIRASSRYSIWILAVCLLFLCGRARRCGFRQPVVLAIIALIAICDQWPPSTGPSETELRQIQNDVQFWKAVEDTLPRDSAVFIFPLMNFPEANPIGRVTTQEPLRGFLNTSTLKFNAGMVYGRHREDWQLAAVQKPVADLVSDLQSHGFSALVLMRGAWPDAGQTVIRQLHSIGFTNQLDDTLNQQVMFQILPLVPDPKSRKS